MSLCDRIEQWVRLEVARQLEGADVDQSQRALNLNGNEGKTAMKQARELVAAARQAAAETRSEPIMDEFDEFDEAGNPSVALLEAVAEAAELQGLSRTAFLVSAGLEKARALESGGD